MIKVKLRGVNILLVRYARGDMIMIFPIAIMFWAVRRINSRRKNANLEEQQKIKEKDKTLSSSSFVSGDASMWILLLFIAMVLSAAGDSGFAYTSAFDVTTVQNYIWMWNILYNSDHLCLAAALIGYKHFFTFSKIDTLQQ
jgi:ABC-type Fe3+ transport system permease subunit